LNQLREEVIPHLFVSVAGFVFHACSFNHSDISPLENQWFASGPKQSIENAPSNLAVPESAWRSAISDDSQTIRR